MTIQEILKAQELSDEQIKAITDAMKENKIFITSEENMDVRYPKLKEQYSESQKLINELKKATKDNEGVQQKISEYETTVKTLQAELVQAKTEAAVKIGLLGAGAKASDIDYLIYKTTHEGDWKPSLTDDGKVKGLDDKIAELKTQYPGQFESSSQKKIIENKLPKADESQTVSKEEFNKMGYMERLKLHNENPEAYNALMGRKE